MKKRKILYVAIMMATIISLPEQSNSQNLEVVGQAKITDMSTDNTANQIVVKQADGTLAVRDAASLLAVGTGNYGTVVNPITGKVWLDRNLGAAQVATSSTDAASYGDLFQWGRNADGHQIPTSGTTTTLASNYFTTSGLFVTTGTSNWLNNVETHMWSGNAAENNPCPSGFRIPTAAEWEQERLTWSTNDAAGAFGSPLKLPMAGYRDGSDGSPIDVGSSGGCWSSTVNGTSSRYLAFGSIFAAMGTSSRSYGFSVRCIKD
ncbi:MAG: hypothetical protein KDC80_23220 [Saprospiraceae bacterium]|nr:hypothetical protein [Saprospiraceae bacterium]